MIACKGRGSTFRRLLIVNLPTYNISKIDCKSVTKIKGNLKIRVKTVRFFFFFSRMSRLRIANVLTQHFSTLVELQHTHY